MGHTFTITTTGGYVALTMAGFKGVAPNPLDVETGSAVGGAGTTAQTGDVTPSMDGELLVTVLTTDAVTGVAINDGFRITDTVPLLSNNNVGAAMAFKIQPKASTENPEWSWTPASARATAIAAFKTAAKR